MRRALLLLLSLSSSLALVSCSKADKPPVSLFDRVAASTDTCALKPSSGTLGTALPEISKLEKVTPDVKSSSFDGVKGSKIYSCTYETKAGAVVLSVLKGPGVVEYLQNAPTTSLRYGSTVSFIALPLAEAMVVEILPDEVAFVAAPGLVSREHLIALTRDLLSSSNVPFPRILPPLGIRPGVDAYRIAAALSVCGEPVSLEATPSSGTPSAFSSPIAGVIDIRPSSPADAYSLATFRRALKATGLVFEDGTLTLSGKTLAATCGSVPATSWVWMYESPSTTLPSRGPIPASEVLDTPVLTNGTRILVEIAATKPTKPAQTPKVLDLTYDVTRTTPASTTP